MERACTCNNIPPPGEPFTDRHCPLCWMWHRQPEYRKEVEAIQKAEHFGSSARRVGAVPGSKLKALLAPLKWPTCGACAALAARMDAGGVAWCRANHAEIVEELFRRGQSMGALRDLEKIGGTDADAREFLGNLVNEAIRQALEDEQRRPFEDLRDGDPICLVMTSVGIGDMLMGLTAVAGLQRQYPSSRVTYQVQQLEPPHDPNYPAKLASLFVDGVNESPPREAVIFYPYHDHGRQMRNQSVIPRWEYYANRCGTTAALPTLKPLPSDDVAWARQYRGAVVLCPFAYHQARRWPIEHWTALEQRLLAEHEKVVVVGGPNCGQINMFRTPHRFRNPAPSRLAALLRKASVFVGNDSGMTHFAGLVGTPTVAIAGGIRGEDIFGIYPSVRALNGPLPCTGCHWLPDLRRRANCHTLDPCASLAAVTPEDARAALKSAKRLQ